MLVMVVNAGSSSLKSQLIETDTHEMLVKCHAEKAGCRDAYMTISYAPEWHTQRFDMPHANVREFLTRFILIMRDDPKCPLNDLHTLAGIGNRIVAGGEWFTESCIVDKEARGYLEKCEELAPLHNPHADDCIDLLHTVLPDIPLVTVFDTAFHSTMPKKSFLFPLPLRYYEQYHIRRYGAHGTSHKYAAEQAAKMMGKPLEDTKIITCHLGNGASISAVQGGKCIDTSMGLTPLDGIMMGTRCGAIDPAIVPFIMRRENLTPDEIDDLMNKKSGLLGISGISGDMRDVFHHAQAGNEQCQLALDMYTYRIQKYIGSYYAILGGCDALVFTAGIGENSPYIRETVCNALAHMGFVIDKELNDSELNNGHENGNFEISTPDSPVKIYIIPADEEMCIAEETARLVAGLNA